MNEITPELIVELREKIRRAKPFYPESERLLLIAAANHLPFLLDEIERLWAEIARLKTVFLIGIYGPPPPEREE